MIYFYLEISLDNWLERLLLDLSWSRTVNRFKNLGSDRIYTELKENNFSIFFVKKLNFVNFLDFIWLVYLTFQKFLNYVWTWTDI